MDTPVSSALMTIIKLAISVLAVIVLFSWITDMLGLREETASLNNLKELKIEIEKLLANAESPISSVTDYYISPDYILVGFSKNREKIGDVCGQETVFKPSRPECHLGSCLCLYKETYGDVDFDDNQPVMCYHLQAEQVSTLDYHKDEGKPYTTEESIWQNIGGSSLEMTNSPYGNFTDEYSSLFIYGQCEDYYGDVSFGIQKLYLEKLEKDNKIYLFLAPARTDTLKARKEALSIKEK